MRSGDDEHLAAQLLIIQSQRTFVSYAVFQGSTPTESEWEQIEAEGLGVRIARLPEGVHDVDFLLPVRPYVTCLDISARGAIDVRAISAYFNLEDLSVYGGVTADVDLTGMTKLASFSGYHRHFESLDQLTTLKSLELDSPVLDRLETIKSAVSYLSLVGATKLEGLPAIERPDELEQLTIHGSRQFDVASLIKYPSLRSVYFSGVKRLSNSGAFLEMASLRGFVLENCREIDNWHELVDLVGVSVRIEGSSPFDESFRIAAANSGSRWTFVPKR